MPFSNPDKQPFQTSQPTAVEILLWSCLGVLVLIYFFYFILIRQDWSLMDHYTLAIEWGKPGFNPYEEGIRFLQGLMNVGRFRPLDVLSSVMRYRFLPVTPRAFHTVQFVLGAIALSALLLTSLRSGLTRVQGALVLIIATGSLSTKDWIFYTSAAEPLATAFLLVSLAFYTSGKKWLAAPLFIASFLTKESFFVFISAFVVLEAWDYYKKRRVAIAPLIASIAATILFVLYIRSLPRIYTAGVSLSNLNLQRLLVALIFPPIKSLLPAVVLVIYSRGRARFPKLNPFESKVALLGATIILSYTLLLAAWGPFDSWFYLHIPIPFGWALLLGAVWIPPRWNADKIGTVLTALTCSFFIMSALNGARNLSDMYSEVRVVAKIACEESKRNPRLQIYNNCNEGSGGLKKYLILNQECVNPPDFHYLKGSSAMLSDIKPPFMLVIAKKCDPFDASSVPSQYTLELSHWTVLKNLSQKQ